MIGSNGVFTVREKPIELEAIHYDGTNIEQVMEFASALGDPVELSYNFEGEVRHLYVHTVNGTLTLPPDTYLVRKYGELLTHTSDEFTRRYEA